MTFEKALEYYTPLGQKILDWMNEHPEISGNEKKTCAYLTTLLKKEGYKIISPRARTKYSFLAYKEKNRAENLPKAAILCEYDAIEDIGQGCGHSASCAASVICALALEKAYEKFPLDIHIIGTPDEEVGGGKIKMMEHGAFSDYQFAIVVQANSENRPYFKTLASSDMLINFYGKEAHASVNPWEGISALNGIQLFFHALDMLRLSLKPGDDVQGVILEGGKIPNRIPQQTTAYIYLKALTINRLIQLKEKVKNCAKGCATAVENMYNISQPNLDYAEVFVGKTEEAIVTAVMDTLGLIWSVDDTPRGSSDIGNLDTMIPVFNPMIATGRSDIALYSREFAALMKTEAGTAVMLNGAKVMGKIIEKLAYNEALLKKVIQEHTIYRKQTSMNPTK